MKALVLSGGGARGAYQAGVCQGIYELCEENHLPNPFKIYSGVSAGAINAVIYASMAHSPLKGAKKAVDLWSELDANRVYKTDLYSLGKNSLAWIRDLSFGALYKQKKANSFLDTSPLRKEIAHHIPLDNLRTLIAEEVIKSVSVTATNYQTSHSTSFIQGKRDFPLWHRSRREGLMADLTVDHIMASSAIPVFFPAINIEGRYFGDGCLRNSTPLSPAIHMGASKLVVVSVHGKGKKHNREDIAQEKSSPGLARVLSTIMNAVFLDGIDSDVERLARINRTLEHIPIKNQEDIKLKKIETIIISPSQDLSLMALKHAHKMAGGVRYLLAGLGEMEELAPILSYLLFDREYCSELIQLGYRDLQKKREEVLAFLRI